MYIYTATCADPVARAGMRPISLLRLSLLRFPLGFSQVRFSLLRLSLLRFSLLRLVDSNISGTRSVFKISC